MKKPHIIIFNPDPWRGDVDGDNSYSFFKRNLDKGKDPFNCDGYWAMVLGTLDFIRDYKGDKPQTAHHLESI